MQEGNRAQVAARAGLAEFDFTDHQCLCCPKCRGEEIEPVDGLATWDEGRYWECKACRIVFEVRRIARELGPLDA